MAGKLSWLEHGANSTKVASLIPAAPSLKKFHTKSQHKTLFKNALSLSFPFCKMKELGQSVTGQTASRMGKLNLLPQPPAVRSVRGIEMQK